MEWIVDSGPSYSQSAERADETNNKRGQGFPGQSNQNFKGINH